MQKRLPFLATHLSIGITEDELNCFEEIALSRAITANNDIMPRREGFRDGLIFVAKRTQSSVANSVEYRNCRKLSADLLNP